MPAPSRRGRRQQAHRLHTLSLLLLGLSLLSFSLSAWFFVAVEQHLDGSVETVGMQPVMVPLRGRVDTAASPALRPALVRPSAGPTTAAASFPFTRPAATADGQRVAAAVPHAVPRPEPTEETPRARPFVHFEPAPITTAAGPQDPNRHVVAPPAVPPSSALPSGAPVAGTAPPGDTGVHPPMEGGFAQDAHRFQLGPGNSPPLTTPVDPRLTWMVIGIFALSNFVLIAVLGGGTPTRTA